MKPGSSFLPSFLGCLCSLLLAGPAEGQVTITVSSGAAKYLPAYRNKLRIRITPTPDTVRFKRTVTLVLNNVSRFPGINGNTPVPADAPRVGGDDYVFLKADQELPEQHFRIATFPRLPQRETGPRDFLRPFDPLDIFFLRQRLIPAQRNAAAGQILRILPSAFAGTGTFLDLGGAVDVFLTSLDHGGICQVVVLEEQQVVTVIDVPVDTDRDLLPDSWESEVAGNLTRVSGDADDEQFAAQESGTLTAYRGPGDGLTAFEEYRGFTIQGVRLRLNEVDDWFSGTGRTGGPRRIDLFLRDDQGGAIDRFIQSNRPWTPWIDEQRVDPNLAVVLPGETPSLGAWRGGMGSGRVNWFSPVRATPLPRVTSTGPLRYRYLSSLATNRRVAVAVHVRFVSSEPTGEDEYGTAFTSEWHHRAPIWINLLLHDRDLRSFLNLQQSPAELARRARVHTLSHELGHRLGALHIVEAPSLGEDTVIPVNRSGPLTALAANRHDAEIVPGVRPNNALGLNLRLQAGARTGTRVELSDLERVIDFTLIDQRSGQASTIGLNDESLRELPVGFLVTLHGARIGWSRRARAGAQARMHDIMQAALDTGVIKGAVTIQGWNGRIMDSGYAWQHARQWRSWDPRSVLRMSAR